MNENYYSRCRVWATAAWSVVAVLFVATCVLMLADEEDWRIAVLLLLASILMSGIAVTLHIRSFMVRLSALVRAAHGVDQPEVRSRGLFPVGSNGRGDQN